MYGDSTVGVVVPAYNEESHVAGVITEVPAFVDRIYAVDDGSTDDTWAAIQRAADEVDGQASADTDGPFPRRVVPIQHEENRGVGGAIKTGYRRALDDEVDVVAVMGGDRQMDPDLLADIVAPVVEGRADYAKGNRLLSPETRRTVPRFRLVGNLLLSALTKAASGYWAIGDSQNGYAAISNDALSDIDLDGLYEDYGYCNDLLVKLNVADAVVVDVPAPIRYGDETSTIRYSTYVPRVSKLLLGNFLWRLREKYLVKNFDPVVLLYALGVAGGLATLLRFLVGLGRPEPVAKDGRVLTPLLLSALVFVLGTVAEKHENEHLAGREAGRTTLDPRTDDSPDRETRRTHPVSSEGRP